MGEAAHLSSAGEALGCHAGVRVVMAETYQDEAQAEREEGRALDFKAASLAGLIVGFLVVLFPRGSPWSGITFFSPTVMGRTMGEPGGSFLMPLLAHLALSLGYAIIIGLVVQRLHRAKAVIAGGIVGVVLFLVNWAVFHFLVRDATARESIVLLTHVGFGLMAAGAYKGHSKPVARRAVASER
jgi:hypothetical protein